MQWTLLILSLPTDNATARMRAWRALKAAGAVVLRDGVYALPDGHRGTLDTVAEEVGGGGGQARVLHGACCDEDLRPLFDRSEAFAAWTLEAEPVRRALDAGRLAEARRGVRRLRRGFDQLAAIDFFAGEAQRQSAQALESLEEGLRRALAPDEPHAVSAPVPPRDRRDFQRRVWATRAHPWVDRLACAWLIRRFIDPEARFLWLATPADRPAQAVGFDFDGAEFSHVGARVSFETLLAAFDLETPALLRLGAIVHALDAGGMMPPETAGVEQVLAGMRESIADDDALVLAAAGVFEGLHVSFERETTE